MPRQTPLDAPPSPAPGRTGPLASLRENPGFRALWVSNVFFFGGAWIQTMVLGWIVFETTRSELHLAVFTAVRLAPMLLGPFAGVLSDRYDRVRLLTLACGWALAAAATVSGLESLTHVPYWALVLGGLAIGLAQSPSQPARSALVLSLVGRRNLSNANALNAMAMNMTQVVGPALGGALISAFGAPAALWISSAWYAASLLALWPLRHTERGGTEQPAAAEPVVAMLVGGLRSVLRNRLAAAVLAVTLAANIFLWPVHQAFMPVFAKESLGLDADGLGWLLTCGGIGGLVGSLVMAALGDFRFKGGLFVYGTAAWAALWALFALSAMSGRLALSFALMAGIGVLSAAFGVLQTTLLLMTTEPAFQGRALGVQELAIGVMPLSSLGLGVAAEYLGVATTTFVSGLLLVLFLATLALRLPALPRYRGV
ncbi:MFS transporter [Streptomyces longispororuber]|uniref:MFS transporter n=1 Tax=Streptomyces longispororuber TaxID=68230 RepID=UPI00210D2A03|nr:MFS transporter [Streptomyces longispororuber]MCQ4207463.1 MFS transporter [Streptomyces longispororuber]